MNNEPVAWIAYDEFGDFMLEATPEGDYPWQPLYTYPAKTLTDEEIMELWYPLDLHDEAWVEDAVLLKFARAILRKAQEADNIESLGTVNIGGVHFRNGKEVK